MDRPIGLFIYIYYKKAYWSINIEARYILFYARFYYTDAHIFILFNEMLTDNIGFWLW